MATLGLKFESGVTSLEDPFEPSYTSDYLAPTSLLQYAGVRCACRGALNVVAEAGCGEGISGVSYSLDL